MKQNALLLLALLLIGCFLAPYSAQAFDSLKFSDAKSYKENTVISFVKKTRNTANVKYIIARVDLNDDAINEYIVKPKSLRNCPKRPLCPYSIIAYQNRLPIIIGQFDAHKMRIEDKNNYGIRQITLYNEKHNDFKTATARWSPSSFRFELP